MVLTGFPKVPKLQQVTSRQGKWPEMKGHTKRIASWHLCAFQNVAFFGVLGSILTKYFSIAKNSAIQVKAWSESCGKSNGKEELYPYASSQSSKYHRFWLQFLLQTYPLQFPYFKQKGGRSANVCKFMRQARLSSCKMSTKNMLKRLHSQAAGSEQQDRTGWVVHRSGLRVHALPVPRTGMKGWFGLICEPTFSSMYGYVWSIYPTFG